MDRVIDAHHHFWRYSAAEYGWIDDSMAALRRDFLPEGLRPALHTAGVDQAISVQARQTMEETRWLLQIAAENPFIAAVVGWVPLASLDAEAAVEEIAAETKLKAVRHVLQEEPDEFMLTPQFQHGIALLRRFGLAYDILIHERQLPTAIELVDRNPGQVFILDHLAKPLIRAGTTQPWATSMRRLAERPNVYCKLSGMVTEADWGAWSAATLQPYIDVALEAFGPRRLMFGSDWPVCLVASSYLRWVETLRECLVRLSEEEQSWIFGRTAAQAYNLPSGSG